MLFLGIGFYGLQYLLPVDSEGSTDTEQDIQQRSVRGEAAEQRPLDSGPHGGERIIHNQQPSSTTPASMEYPKLATQEDNPTRVFRCPSPSDDDTDSEDEEEREPSVPKTSKLPEEVQLSLEMPHTHAQIPMSIRIFREMRQENESLKAANAILKSKQHRMNREAKSMATEITRLTKKMNVTTTELSQMKRITHKTKAEISAENQVKELEVLLNKGYNATEIKRLQLQHDTLKGEVKAANETVEALQKNPVERDLLEKHRLEMATLEKGYLEKECRLGEEVVTASENLGRTQDELNTLKDSSAKEIEKLKVQLASMTEHRDIISADYNKVVFKVDSLQSQHENDAANALSEANGTAQQLQMLAEQLNQANSRAELLKRQLSEKTTKDAEMVDASAPHICDHSRCKEQFDRKVQDGENLRKRLLDLTQENSRLRTSITEGKAPLKRDLKEATEARDAAHRNVTMIRKEKDHLETKVRDLTRRLEHGASERATLEHEIAGLKESVKAYSNVIATSQSGNGQVSNTQVRVGGGRRKREDEEVQTQQPDEVDNAPKEERTAPLAKHIKGPEPKRMPEAPIRAVSRDLLKGKFGREAADQFEKWFGIMGVSKQPGKHSSALQTWMKFLQEDFDDLLNACQTVALHMNLVTVHDLQDHGLMLFAFHVNGFVQHCLSTGMWTVEQQGKMRSVQKYAQMISEYAHKAGAEFKDCKDPTTFYGCK